MTQKRGLGMGLSALIPQNTEEAQAEGSVSTLKITDIEPNREQPRKTFDEEALAELSDSIKEYGVLQPIIVRQIDGYYEIVTGERRWRAARIAGLSEIPVIIKDYDAQKSIEVALIENLQRENLNSIEEARTYKRLQDEFNLTQDAISERVGKKRSTITNSLRILNLSDEVQQLVAENKITAGHAKALLSVNDHYIQDDMAQKIIEMDLSVRQTEKLMQKISIQKKTEKDVSDNKDKNIYYKSVENDLNSLFGTKVKVQSGKNKGKIEIEFFSDTDLDRLIEMFKKLGG